MSTGVPQVIWYSFRRESKTSSGTINSEPAMIAGATCPTGYGQINLRQPHFNIYFISKKDEAT